jgi:hypothetical protein
LYRYDEVYEAAYSPERFHPGVTIFGQTPALKNDPEAQFYRYDPFPNAVVGLYRF